MKVLSFVDKAIIALILAVIVGLGLWWSWDSFVDGIRAPVVARAEAAEGANKSLAEANADLILDNKRLDNIVKSRTTREAKSDRKLEDDKNAAQNSKDPEVTAWRPLVVPAGLIGLQSFPDQATDSKGGAPSRFGSVKPDPANQPAATAPAGIDQRPTMGSQDNVGVPAESLQQPTGRCAGVVTGVCGAYNRLFGKVKPQ